MDPSSPLIRGFDGIVDKCTLHVLAQRPTDFIVLTTHVGILLKCGLGFSRLSGGTCDCAFLMSSQVMPTTLCSARTDVWWRICLKII